MFGRWTAPLLKNHYDAVLRARDEDTERTRQQMELRLDAHNDIINRFVTRAELQASEARMRATVVAAAAVVSAGCTVVLLIK